MTDKTLILRALTTEITAAYVSHNHLASAELPALIVKVYTALTALALQPPLATFGSEGELKSTLAQIHKSITPEALISFIDGMPYKILKRHLRKHGLDPRGYRQKFGLPDDYPMVAPFYSEYRAMLAKGYIFSKYRLRKAS